ncbi:YkvA family protein [Hymenobacter sp. 5516J-16]|uniref:YkvA family protein n=1 Tax=Hymenobacter sublimis TaxID=2933777 RepID=A0ABY4JEV3_9BACT|nr:MULTISPECIES: YkvA family protein [Hymenobacter]UOQ77463.1 YkvA family protein [Hymenobacter sp. 5516J-16]UPL51135.1 YkvA family protein [Hymenobacter sublimis]
MASLLDKGFSISKNALFSVFLNRAGKLLGRPFKVVMVLNEVANKLASKESKDSKFKQLFDVGYTVVRLVRNYVSGSYRQIETGTIVSALGVLLYTLSPVDLVPDFVPVVGFLDDLALLSWFVEKFQGEIVRFREWEQTNAAEETDDIPAASAKPVYAASNTNAENAPAVAEMGHS